MFTLMPRRERTALARPFEWFAREFAPLFERAFPMLPFEARWEPYWGFETEELANEYVIRAEVPGFEASELEVAMTGNDDPAIVGKTIKVVGERTEIGRFAEGKLPAGNRVR
jgi:HSP20 family molecular chaperone IbpA